MYASLCPSLVPPRAEHNSRLSVVGFSLQRRPFYSQRRTQRKQPIKFLFPRELDNLSSFLSLSLSFSLSTQRDAYERRREEKRRRGRRKEEERKRSDPSIEWTNSCTCSGPARFHKTLTSVVVTESRRGSREASPLSGLSFVPLACLDPFPPRPLDPSIHYTPSIRGGDYVNRRVDEKGRARWMAKTARRKPRPVSSSMRTVMSSARLINAACLVCWFRAVAVYRETRHLQTFAR